MLLFIGLSLNDLKKIAFFYFFGLVSIQCAIVAERRRKEKKIQSDYYKSVLNSYIDLEFKESNKIALT